MKMTLPILAALMLGVVSHQALAQSQQEAQPHLQPDSCPCGGQALALVRINPGFGPIPELRTYRCAKCGAVETIEVRRRAGG